ncbi:MFS transporter [Asanoa ishikariensis]|uniref:Predicted arabinose efflux permease, MFS family n=1 Tax=Asanoa ishikariensis TaxID=137265 RepID=A0A1H3R6U1_9ACTN|nr:MFS transporter [Asanoa ishikariensis]GIF64353.1 MFS transporter [Asanoa ishikariensis]SDZ21387.1 Predicted arabinose efflux permease, MFS family [Asanoa ishikariensis]
MTAGGGTVAGRDFRLFWLGQATSKLGSSVSSVALPLVAVATLDAGTLQVALLAAFTWLPWLLIGLPAGAWVDRLPRRPLMIGCDLLCLVVFLSVPLAWWLGTLTLTHLFIAALVSGTAGVFFQTADQVFLPTLLSPGDLPGGNTRLQSTEQAAHVAGPGVAGLLTQLAGAVAGLLVDAVSFLVSAICLWRIRVPERLHRGPRRSLKAEVAEGLRFVARDPYLRVLTIWGAVSNLALIGYQSVLVVFLVREVGVAPGVVGGLIAATSLGGVLGAAAGSALGRRLGTARALLASNVLATPFGLLLPLAERGPRLALAVAGVAVLIAGVSAGNVVKGSFRQTYVPHELLGRVTVSMQLLNYGTIPLGALIGGVLGASIGLRPTIWLSMVAAVASGLILLIGPIRTARDLPSTPRSTPRELVHAG